MTIAALASQRSESNPRYQPLHGNYVTGSSTPESFNDRHLGGLGNFIHPWSVNKRKVRLVSISYQAPNDSRPHPSRAYELLRYHGRRCRTVEDAERRGCQANTNIGHRERGEFSCINNGPGGFWFRHRRTKGEGGRSLTLSHNILSAPIRLPPHMASLDVGSAKLYSPHGLAITCPDIPTSTIMIMNSPHTSPPIRPSVLHAPSSTLPAPRLPPIDAHLQL